MQKARKGYQEWRASLDGGSSGEEPENEHDKLRDREEGQEGRRRPSGARNVRPYPIHQDKQDKHHADSDIYKNGIKTGMKPKSVFISKNRRFTDWLTRYA